MKGMNVNYGWCWVVVMFLVSNCVHDPLIIPENPGENPEPGCTASETVCFESNVLPIFVSSCAKPGCHDAITHEEGFILDSYSNIMREGIKPGNANDSKLYEVLFASGEDRMPPYPNPALTQAQKDSIELWINQGAKNTTDCNCYCDENQFTYVAIIQPLMSKNCVGCHKPGALSGNIDLSTYEAVKAQADNGNLLGTITHAVGFVAMPYPNGKLSDCEIAQVTKWIDAGALDN